MQCIEQVGNGLLSRYSRSIAVRPVKVASSIRLLPSFAGVTRYARDDLLHLAMSPDYCRPQPQFGSLGTHGR